MRLLILILFLVALGLICFGYFGDSEYSQKYIGFGVVTLFVLVFPLFSYYRWKDKNVKDYMLTKENLDKMREREGDTRR